MMQGIEEYIKKDIDFIINTYINLYERSNNIIKYNIKKIHNLVMITLTVTDICSFFLNLKHKNK